MFKVNDHVIYGLHGVCRITDIAKKSFHGVTREYCVLQPVYMNNTTVCVPTANQTLLAKMRPVLSRDELNDVIQSVPDDTIHWIEDDNNRKNRYKEILSKGDRKELVKLIKTLYQHQGEQKTNGKNLHASDERFLKEAEKALCEEFAFILNIKPEKVLPFMLEHI